MRSPCRRPGPPKRALHRQARSFRAGTHRPLHIADTGLSGRRRALFPVSASPRLRTSCMASNPSRVGNCIITPVKGRFRDRAFAVPIESERGSSSLFVRIFATQTVFHLLETALTVAAGGGRKIALCPSLNRVLLAANPAAWHFAVQRAAHLKEALAHSRGGCPDFGKRRILPARPTIRSLFAFSTPSGTPAGFRSMGRTTIRSSPWTALEHNRCCNSPC